MHTPPVPRSTQHLFPVPVATRVAVQVLPHVMSISSISGTHQLHHHGNCVKLNWRVNDCKKKQVTSCLQFERNLLGLNCTVEPLRCKWFYIYRPQGKVMFSHVFVCPQSASWLLGHWSSLLWQGRYVCYWNAFFSSMLWTKRNAKYFQNINWYI